MDENRGPLSDETALKEAMGRAIAHARVDAGFPTQAAFSRAIDVRFQYMSRVEKGEENLTLETLAKMTGVLGIPMPEFLARVAEQMRQPSHPPAARRGRRAAE
jgi:transcriptional regulator with XRE-family HTH domain